MKAIGLHLTRPLFESPPAGLTVRNQKEDIIAQIVEQTTEKNKKNLAKVLAIHVNTFKLSTTDLHALLKKKGEVKNYTAFVWWVCKSKKM